MNTDERSVRRLRHDPDDRPFIVIWEVTRACQLVCGHCRADAIATRHPAELTLTEGRRLLDDLAGLGTPRPLVVLTGGDPFERDDLVDLVAHGTSRGLHVSLSPSVTPRLTRPTLARLHDAGARAISLSLDGATAATHDGLRGIPGVFDATIEAAAWVREAGFRLQVNTTVTRATAPELPGTLAHALAMDAALWSVFFLVPTGRGADVDGLDADEVEDVLLWLHDTAQHVAVKTTEAPHFRRIVLQSQAGTAPAGGSLYAALRTDSIRHGLGSAPTRRRPRPPLEVNAGKGFVFVDHIGTVYPSGFLPVPVGSVRERPLSAIYRGSPLLRQLRDPDALTGRCGSCAFREVCGGSRSRAFATSGDPLGDDPLCAYDPHSDL